MPAEALIIAAVALVTAALLTGFVRSKAIARGMLDVPNQRSSHVVPTPRGGGLAIAVATGLALIALVYLETMPLDIAMALGGGGAAIAIVGWIDDRRPLRVSIRLPVHFAAAVWALAWLGGLPPLQIGHHVVDFGITGYLLGAVGIVWTLNLFNFMDGIDGIAGSEAVFVAWAGGALAFLAGGTSPVVVTGLAFGAACIGFLLWNWPPARIFMGDVGSGFLGYFIAVLAIAASRSDPVALLVWVILGGVFFVDSTVTFVRRLARRERVHEPHRTHAYQWLARRWGSHRRVTVAVLIVNVFWLLPCAWAAARYPSLAAVILPGALLPVAVMALLAGAGRQQGGAA
jgi:Fuc2NAc and GlcNAc transferase